MSLAEDCDVGVPRWSRRRSAIVGAVLTEADPVRHLYAESCWHVPAMAGRGQRQRAWRLLPGVQTPLCGHVSSGRCL